MSFTATYFVYLMWFLGCAYIDWKEGERDPFNVLVFIHIMVFWIFCVPCVIVGKELPRYPWRYVCMDEEGKREVVREDVERWSEERFGSRFDFFL